MDKLITNKEHLLNAILTGNTSGLPEPKTREEALLKEIAESGVGGTNGKSAYAIAVENGYEGTEAEFGAGLAQNAETMTKAEMLDILNGGVEL